MNWQDEYQKRLTTAEEAVKAVNSGDHVAIPVYSNPSVIAKALANRLTELTGVTVLLGAAASDLPWYHPEAARAFHIEPWYTSPYLPKPIRQMVLEKRSDHRVCPSALLFKALSEGRADARPPDVALLDVSPPDHNGFVSLGAGVWDKKELIQYARTVIAEVNPSFVRTAGENFVPLSDIDYFVELPGSEEFRPPFPAVEVSEQVKRIAAHVAPLIRDGDTVEVGAGSTSEALVQAGIFAGRNDLGWHTERIPRGGVELVRQGIFTGARKTLHPGRAVATAVAFSREEREFVHYNPHFELYRVAYINHIGTIAAHDNMVAINNALRVDLTGQVVADSFGPQMFTGTGGLPEYAIASVYAKGGRSVIVLPSTTSDGKISRIVPLIEEGSFVTSPRQFTDYVVTEYGVARLFGKTQRRRAEELIAIAHPDFRPELEKAAKRLFWP
ncbi:MAG: acetyl-CoA hydrolase/transferase C-terminal domain-containing protein [Thermodesulfobacteriota bacterium]|jgi:acyl-CoA hydrolase